MPPRTRPGGERRGAAKACAPTLTPPACPSCEASDRSARILAEGSLWEGQGSPQTFNCRRNASDANDANAGLVNKLSGRNCA
eukprot:6605120-Prymnesium_polylepis.1